MKLLNMAACAAMIFAVSSCGIYGKYSTPTDTPLMQEYATAAEAAPDSTAFGNLQWQSVFSDPVLSALIDSALVRNTNLRNAQLNVEVAQANLKGAQLAYLPSVALAPNGAGASYAGSDLRWTYSIPAQVSWEIDIFGKLLNSKRAAKAAVLKSEAYAQAVRSQIIAGVATTYYAIAAAESQLDLMRSTAEIWKETVQTMRDLKDAGRGVTEAAVVQSAANYYSILANITDMEVSLAQLNNTMSLLQCRLPQVWDIPAGASLEVPEILRDGVPMAELAARPDVRAAEQDLAAAFYATNSARAAFYPGITITANGGFTNLLGSVIKNPGDWFYQLAGSIAAPLFARGQNIARLKAAKAQQKQVLNNFEYALISAAAEVGDALDIYEHNAQKGIFLDSQIDNLEKSVEYTKDLMLYSTGTTNYLEVLTAQSSLLNARTSRINTSLARSRAVINLYQALGGGR